MASMTTQAERTPRPALSAGLLEEAERLGLDIADVDHIELAAEVNRRWREDNAEALASSNSWVEKNGLPLEHLRMF
jgi:antitoxin CcdA